MRRKEEDVVHVCLGMKLVHGGTTMSASESTASRSGVTSARDKSAKSPLRLLICAGWSVQSKPGSSWLRKPVSRKRRHHLESFAISLTFSPALL
jgi:hypothetical protein